MSTPHGADEKTSKCDPPKPLPEAEVGIPSESRPIPNQAPTDDASVTSYGPYKPGRKLGEGGFGAVYEAEQEYPIRRRVALKVIKLGMDTREVIARFEAERQALALMEHPNIARVLDVGANQAGRPYFVMELVQGEPISSYCDAHRLSVADRLRLFDQVCAAVQHAHTKGVIHRDLKPSNVLVSTVNDQPLAKVIDFGIAKATSGHLTERGLLTQQLQMIGTPHYMSPEQAQGSADIDTRADIYSLGVMLYQLLVEATPFDSSSLHRAQYSEILHIICEVEPPRPSARLAQSETSLSEIASKRRIEPRKLIKTVRGELDWIVMKAIDKDRTRRYETANALASDVRRYLAREPLLAAPPSTLYRVGKLVRRNRLAVGAGLVVAASLVVGVVAFAWQTRIAQQQAHIAQLRAAELEQVSKFQADMLSQVDPTAAGILLGKDLEAKFEAALTKAGVPEAARDVRLESFSRDWKQVNATDAARDLIDRTILKPAVDAIDKQFKDQPVVDAALRQALANRYVDMGLFETARPLQERALATRRSVLGEEHPETLRSVGRMGELLMAQGKPSEAEPYLRRALEASRRVLGGDHPDTVGMINDMGSVGWVQGKLNEAEPYLREGLEKSRHLLGKDNPHTIDATYMMGLLLFERGKHREALPYFRDTVEGNRRIRGEEAPETLSAISNLGVNLLRDGKVDEAEPYLRAALEKMRRLQGEEYPTTILAISRMGELLWRQGKLDEAQPYARDALEKSRRVLGQDHRYTVTAISLMGSLLQVQGKLSEAEPLFRAALETNRRVLGEARTSTLISLNLLGSLLVAQGNHAEAAELLAPAEAATRAAFTDDNAFRTSGLLMNLGKARTGLGEYAAAEANLLEAHGIFVKNPGPIPADTHDCVRAIVDLYMAWNRAEPGKGYDAKGAEWKRKVEALDAAGAAQVVPKPATERPAAPASWSIGQPD